MLKHTKLQTTRTQNRMLAAIMQVVATWKIAPVMRPAALLACMRAFDDCMGNAIERACLMHPPTPVKPVR